jgi:signal-transduction protein with cAMP-binding, CBS, and nucleotidyltransferase domain
MNPYSNPNHSIKKGTIGELLQNKGGNIWSIDPGASVYEALQIMAEKDVGALIVIEEGKLIGIFSERDYARKVILKGRTSKETKVSELMTQKVLYVTPEMTINECMALITDKRIRHLPVLKDGQLVGIVTIGDVVKSIISEQEITISELVKYIAGLG